MAPTHGRTKRRDATPVGRRKGAATKTKKRWSKDLVSDQWRYVAVKVGSHFYITEMGPGARGRKTRLFRAPGRKVRLKRHSTFPEKLAQAFAAAVKSAP
jgi:hypothetical protein